MSTSCDFSAMTSAASRDVSPRATNGHAGDGHAGNNRLLAIVAHELRNPLMPIRNAAAILKREPVEPSTRRRALEIIDRQLDGMTRLINDLIDVSRLQSGNLELLKLPVTLAEVAERSVEMITPYVTEHGHYLFVSISPEPVRLVIDELRICQVLQNLISNAVKYTDPGGQIKLRARCEGNEVVIVVSDTGIGISPEKLPGLFELFAQAGQSGAARSEGGLGIGLFLARHLVEAHGGTITATSAGRGLGSEFTVRLPCEGHDAHDTSLKTKGVARAADPSPP